MAQNLKAYDGIFIMNYLANNPLPGDKYNALTNGGKVQLITVYRVKIIDSFNFIPFALSKFGKAFGVSELKKGFFPHKFNTPLHQNYVGQHPDKSYYGTEFMSVTDKADFESGMLKFNLNNSI